MSDQQNTGGHNIKVMLSLIVSGVVVLAGGGYALWTHVAAPPEAESRVDLNRVGGTAQSGAQESPAYRELLRENNARGAQAAAAQNGSFIASIPLQQDVIVAGAPPQTTAGAPAAPRPAAGQPAGGRTQEQEKALNEARQKALAGLLARLQHPPAAAELPEAQVLGGKEGGWSAWRDSLPGNAVQLAAQQGRGNVLSGQPPVEVVAPYWRGPGEIYTGVNSDNGDTPVLGRFVSGPYAGAILKASDGAKLSGDGVIIHFTTMALGGQNYKIDAYALQDDTLVANVSTDVEHHYVRRIILPSILKGIGGTGDLYAQSNTQLLSNGFNTVTTRPATPDASAVAGVIVGDTAGQAAQVLSSDAARLPDRTVTVNSGQVVAIQFMRGVYSTDAEATPGTVSTAASAAASAGPLTSNPSPSAAELRAQTQARIRAAQQKGDTLD
ncbi:conjugal transfer protein TraO [Rahnella sp. BCC 1045]|uniref:conjugal transfer protein TraO n=1 Tax=Rahnella sp. BCC 1045 TaxID=2816251 RepID=UPI001C25F052|nr:conjugal transfer protein TraO [Rahnella sp. BCC 1045]MBU9819665.1 conjugal transfer protein TraO [Rahnella sp. BCC 1045]